MVIKLIKIFIVQTCMDFNVNSDKVASRGLPPFPAVRVQKLSRWPAEERASPRATPLPRGGTGNTGAADPKDGTAAPMSHGTTVK